MKNNEFIGDKIRKLCFNYARDYYGQDDLRTALICAIQSLGLTKSEAFKELYFILRYESDEKETEVYLKGLKQRIEPSEFRIKNLEQVQNAFFQGYNILMEYWDYLLDKEKPEIDKRLKRAGL